MQNFINKIKAELAVREEGQGTVEYAVVLGVIIVGVVGLFRLAPVDTAINALINNITTLI